MIRSTRRPFAISAASLTALAAPAVRAQVATPGSTPGATPLATPVSGGLRVSMIDTITIPNDLMVGDTLVGGISGLDFDAAAGVWYFLFDDRSDYQPARFYTGTVSYDDTGFTEVNLNEVVTLLQEDGTPFPNGEVGGNVPDPESIRKDPNNDLLWWTSEGSYELDIDPFVGIANPDGSMSSMIPMSAPFVMESGPRENLVFEGFSFSADGESVWLGMEGALYQDGPISSNKNSSFVRLINLDRDGNVLRQVALELDMIDAPDDAPFVTSGYTEILALEDDRMLAISRATVADDAGVYRNFVRLWDLDLSVATDISGIESLQDAKFVPAERRLVIDFNEAGLDPVDNLEAITFGPNLPNGNRALVVASDNNFNVDTQVTQFVLLEVLG